MTLTLTEAQRTLLGIISSVEAGAYTPEDAVEELTRLKGQASKAGLRFRADYTLADFQNIREKYLSEYNEPDLYDYGSYEEDDLGETV